MDQEQLNLDILSALPDDPLYIAHLKELKPHWSVTYTVLGLGWSLTLYMYISIKFHSNQNYSGRDFYIYFLR